MAGGDSAQPHDGDDPDDGDDADDTELVTLGTVVDAPGRALLPQAVSVMASKKVARRRDTTREW